MDPVVSLLVFGSMVCSIEAGRCRARSRAAAFLGVDRHAALGGEPMSAVRALLLRVRKGSPRAISAAAGALIGSKVAGPVGLVAGAVAGWLLPRFVEHRRVHRLTEKLERDLADVVESTVMAVASGQSIPQALEFAAAESEPPMSGFLGRLLDERGVGAPFEEALWRYADALGTDDARLFVLILSIHQRSGGNMTSALDEVASTIRHRMSVRRELRALTAQGRVSGGILGALPIGFFLVLSATSQHDLAPVYRSPAGIAMIGAGLGLEALAFLWIRRLLKVHL